LCGAQKQLFIGYQRLNNSSDFGQSVLYRFWQADRHKGIGRLDDRLSGFINHSRQVIFASLQEGTNKFRQLVEVKSAGLMRDWSG
jgi:hypothetical protein